MISAGSGTTIRDSGTAYRNVVFIALLEAGPNLDVPGVSRSGDSTTSSDEAMTDVPTASEDNGVHMEVKSDSDHVPLASSDDSDHEDEDCDDSIGYEDVKAVVEPPLDYHIIPVTPSYSCIPFQ